MYYGVEREFWLYLMLVLAIVVLLFYSFNQMMRRILKLEKEEITYDYYNKQHKRIDWTARIIFLIVLFIGYFINIGRGPMESIWFLEPYFLIFILIVATGAIRAYMQWKFDGNRKMYLFTVSQLAFVIILLGSVFMTGFFGLFD